jgi:cellulose synthase/poly-beta-1,6-N-acetylglucosamine synthase-like glycosyltransferase
VLASVITLVRTLYAVALALPVLVYIVYPVLVRLAARALGSRWTPALGEWPTVTVAIAAHNEERDIARVVESILAADYPGPPIHVLVGLDGCTDRTAAVLASIGDPRVGWLDLERAGKAATDNRLVAAIDTDVIVTTAAGAVYDPGALERLVDPFRDPSVGCVSGVFAPRQDGTGAAGDEGLYWRMEYALMAAESDLGILACASGTSMAHRRSIFRPIPLDSDGDVSLAPNAAEQGYRVRFVRDAVVRDDGPADRRTVLRNRRRMALRALPTTATFVGRLLRAHRSGPAVALLVHKLLRWLVPWCIALWLIAAMGLALLGDQSANRLTVALLAGALLAIGLSAAAGPRVRGAVLSFGTAQLAFALATFDAARGRRARMWNRG